MGSLLLMRIPVNCNSKAIDAERIVISRSAAAAEQILRSNPDTVYAIQKTGSEFSGLNNPGRFLISCIESRDDHTFETIEKTLTEIFAQAQTAGRKVTQERQLDAAGNYRSVTTISEVPWQRQHGLK